VEVAGGYRICVRARSDYYGSGNLYARLCRCPSGFFQGTPNTRTLHWVMSWPALSRIGLLSCRVFAGVVSMIYTATALEVVFSMVYWGHAVAGVGVLGMVRPSWCRRPNVERRLVPRLARLGLPAFVPFLWVNLVGAKF
jgi:hypothetical protein